MVVGNVDYETFRDTLFRMEKIVEQSGVEQAFVQSRLDAYLAHAMVEAMEAGESFREPSDLALSHVVKRAVQALRCNIARELTGDDCRGFSTRLADSPLLRRFCLIDGFAPIQVPSKSTIDRYARLVHEEVVRKIVDQVNRVAAGTASGEEPPLGLAQALDVNAYFLDSTCVKANIHFPVDWVLLRDATRTLIQSIVVIRRHGLKHRIGTPEMFITKMNRLCIEMTQAGRKKDGRKDRKRVLRSMKRLMKVIEKHARRYRQEFSERWSETLLSQGRVQQILRRMDAVLEVLPAAIAQATERVIRERQVPNKEKILSLYEPDIHVVVRGKAGAKVEFGNSLLLAEVSQGVIVDWKLTQDEVPSDASLVEGTLERFRDVFGRYPDAVATDRGFDGPANRTLLHEEKIYNAICPKSPRRLKERMTEEAFIALQKRRAQTEARVGIFKNGFLGRPMRTKGFLHRESNVAWAVLAHNLWVIARLKTLAQQMEEQYRNVA
jgi:hypothetical protein